LNSNTPNVHYLADLEDRFSGADTEYYVVYVLGNTLNHKKKFNYKTGLDGIIAACQAAMYLPESMREPKWYPIAL
jgi:hypothetical protein